VHADIEEDEDVEDLQSRLSERDAALEITRDAMENLTKLIKRLISGGGLDGQGFSAIATTVKVQGIVTSASNLFEGVTFACIIPARDYFELLMRKIREIVQKRRLYCCVTKVVVFGAPLQFF
jgi:hypothetical protein